VFAGQSVASVEEITENWERIKRAEKERDSVLDGIVLSQPALALAAKILQRAERGGQRGSEGLSRSFAMHLEPCARLAVSSLVRHDHGQRSVRVRGAVNDLLAPSAYAT
jgi:uncharacterized protein YabN with tetrapyrrole methylase and pyrophosphatase domain